MKIYTKTGDSGETGLWGGLRVAKDALRVHAYGTVDECNAAIGLARAMGLDAEMDAVLSQVQDQLFVVGADLATPGEAASIPRVGAEAVGFLERTIDATETELEPLKQFIHPGGYLAAAQLHVARTICRRAERWVVSLAREEPINLQVQTYLNRLSDMLFVLARAANSRAGVADVPWNSPRFQ
ncbi:cob(I)yrinic acid a,c-diamide adenosyltransferase [Candidatus Gracilibacteria bacterium]|nr:cob(I)yrinic acid a,c-diamide adenosyltransferase [Candidatus Gracilibacteria bacterium]